MSNKLIVVIALILTLISNPANSYGYDPYDPNSTSRKLHDDMERQRQKTPLEVLEEHSPDFDKERQKRTERRMNRFLDDHGYYRN